MCQVFATVLRLNFFPFFCSCFSRSTLLRVNEYNGFAKAELSAELHHVTGKK
jgi:hypothetical protein